MSKLLYKGSVVDPLTQIEYEYEIRKSICYKGIVPYSVVQRLEKQLSKKHKWLKEIKNENNTSRLHQ